MSTKLFCAILISCIFVSGLVAETGVMITGATV